MMDHELVEAQAELIEAARAALDDLVIESHEIDGSDYRSCCSDSASDPHARDCKAMNTLHAMALHDDQEDWVTRWAQQSNCYICKKRVPQCTCTTGPRIKI